MKDDTLLIAGPCSAESREQVLATAKGLSRRKVDYFRAGIWKPRTQPGSLEGRGPNRPAVAQGSQGDIRHEDLHRGGR